MRILNESAKYFLYTFLYFYIGCICLAFSYTRSSSSSKERNYKSLRLPISILLFWPVMIASALISILPAAFIWPLVNAKNAISESYIRSVRYAIKENIDNEQK